MLPQTTLELPLTVNSSPLPLTWMVSPWRVLWLPASWSGVSWPGTTGEGSTGVSRPLGSPRALSRVGLGTAAKASLVGANTVMPWALFRVPARSAFLTAVTRVDSWEVLEAAVATGSLASASRLPAPLAGTAEQAAPNGPDAVIDAAVVDGAGVWLPEVPASLLLQAAPKSAIPSTPATAARRGVRR